MTMSDLFNTALIFISTKSMIILDLPFKAGSNERRVAIEAPHVDLDVWSAEQHLNYPGVILLNRDDQRSVS